jgi:hypothetical protein
MRVESDKSKPHAFAIINIDCKAIEAIGGTVNPVDSKGQMEIAVPAVDRSDFYSKLESELMRETTPALARMLVSEVGARLFFEDFRKFLR